MSIFVACIIITATLVPVVLGEGARSPRVGNATLDPIPSTVLEQWSGLRERSEKVMKKPDRHIVNRPPSPSSSSSPQDHRKEVSETDLFLLGAIEKLAHKLEHLEKRLTRTEEMLFRLVSGNQFNEEKEDPCPESFRRYGGVCYHVSAKQTNWKSASSACRGLGSALVEFETADEEKALVDVLRADPALQGKDFWTGGLNPGLLWIWSNSAKPVATDSSATGERKEIDGSGRCLVLKYQALTRTYVYRGVDCSTRNAYICRSADNAVGRGLERLQRELRSRASPRSISG